MPLRGHGIRGVGALGYDPKKNKFVGTWNDSTNTALTIMEGEIDPKTNALVVRWMSTDPMTGPEASHRYELVSKPDSYTSTFLRGEGAGTKTMVIGLRRKRAQQDSIRRSRAASRGRAQRTRTSPRVRSA